MNAPTDVNADWSTLLRQSIDTADIFFEGARNTLRESGLDYTTADVIQLANITSVDYTNTCHLVIAQKLQAAVVNLVEGYYVQK